MTKPTGKLPGNTGNLRRGGGRPKGVPNKTTQAIKDMITQALDQAGGVTYLVEQAEKNPGPFLTLVGKVLPMQLTGEGGGPIKTVNEVVRRVIDPHAA